MFGTLAHPRKPILLLLVFGVFLVIVGITALAQSILVSTTYRQSILESVVGSDAATIRAVANQTLEIADLDPEATTYTLAAQLQKPLHDLRSEGGIARVEIRRPDGTVIASDEYSVAGSTAAGSEDFAKAVAGIPTATFVQPASSEALGPLLAPPSLLREYFPLKKDGQVLAVVGLWRDGDPISATLGLVRQDVIIVTLTAGLVAAFVLFLVFRAGQGRISRQTEQLVEATRRDPLTDTPNHGTLVAALAAAIETARTAKEPIAVALLDIDNFRLLNDTHGHAAGDEAILTLAELLRAEFPSEATLGRYGPDEFLVIEPSVDAEVLEHGIERLRAGAWPSAPSSSASPSRCRSRSAPASARTPTTRGSVTDLLSAATITLQEAKTSGGDAVRMAGAEPRDPGRDPHVRRLPGPDPGCRRSRPLHEAPLGGRRPLRGVPRRTDRTRPETISTVRVAGLLHDVGKIGVPDGILRKPARLTEDEFTIMKQHVALGDMIVRDLPNCDLVRAGIRYHHERWDGGGYPDGLAAEDIPLVARIVAVADAFSAMTTTRPYRKALDVDEALGRLEAAAGSQLDERLVVVFVEGLRTATDAPPPGLDIAPGRLWAPYTKVA